ncbi:MAG TPA: CHAT domain-containing protein [Pyrinomonadaceae bacterium]
MRSPLRTSYLRGAGLAVCLLFAAQNYPARQTPLLNAPAHDSNRPASDARRLAAEAAYAEAQRLRARESEESVQRAVKSYEKALTLWKAVGDAGGVVRSLRSLGQSYSRLGEPRRALDYLQQSLALCPASGDAGCEAATRNELSASYLIIGELEKSWQHCSGALELSRANGDRAGEARALNNMGEVYYFRGDREKALEPNRLALPIWKALGDLRGQAQTLLHIGYSHSDLGDARAALSHFEQALALWRESEDERGQALTLTAVGHLHNGFGEKQAAIESYDRAAPLFRRLGDKLGEARTLNGMGYLYMALGEGPKAVGYFNRARRLFQAVGYKSGEAGSLEVAGRTYYAMGQYRTALDCYLESLTLTRSLADERGEAFLLADIGIAYAALGETAKGLDHCNRALALNRKIKDRIGESYILLGVARLREELGGRADALAVYNEALTLARATGVQSDEADALYNVARVEHELGDWAAARTHVEEALALSDSLRTKIADREMRAAYSSTFHRLSELYIDTLMRLHDGRPSDRLNARAFEASEQGRARSLLETLAEYGKDIRHGVDAGLLMRERELQQRISAKAERRVQLLSVGANAAGVPEIERELSELTTEYQHVRGQIRAASPSYAALMQPAPLALGEIQRKVLDADTLLLEYALGEKRSFVWAVTHESMKSFELPPRAEVEKAARRVYELLTTRNRRAAGETEPQRLANVRRAEAEYVDASAALGRMLLGPVAKELGMKRLVVVADGALQYVSFAALPAPDTAVASQPDVGFVPLIVEHEVVVLPSASVLALTREELRERRPAPKSVAVLADPVFDGDDERLESAKGTRARRRVEVAAGGAAAGVAQRAIRGFDGLDDGAGIARLLFSRREASAIMASVPSAEGMLALGFRASRATAMSPELSQYRIVHFATHGLLNSENPELSGVILSRFDESGRPQDGFLASYEIYNLNLPAELVVLSACQTALGKDVRGEGLVGLTRGFMYAGARRVVASLWKVDDSATAELMGQFYREMLGKGLRPADALRAAQLHMWQQPRWRSPYFWAAFTLQGEWR